MNDPKVVAVISHDAGGAEILASYVAQNKIDYRFVLGGPAVNVFRRRLGIVEICTLEDGLAACDWCLCGSSWQSDLEWNAIKQARGAGKRVVTFLDHWVNYPERFIRNGVQHLPDEIWVGDEDAKKLAGKCFPGLGIKRIHNPYFIDMQREIAELEKKSTAAKGGKSVLFVSENISDHARLRYGNERYWGYTEFDAIEYFFEHINVFGEKIRAVVIRPHPSDSPGKYDRIVAKYADIARLSDGSPLLEEIVTSDIVVGCQSVAMVVGLLAHKKVISCIPPYGRGCSLPQKDILHLGALVA